MTEHVRVLVIGGGAVGCSALYHLALRGWTDALLVERDELTAGSTWHAAGNCPTFSTSWGLMRLQAYSAALYRRLASGDYPIAYHVTGSLRLAHGRERMDEFRHVRAMAKANGLDYEIVGPTELRARYPFVETHGLEGALWDPLDGDIDPAQLTQALAHAARGLGARIRRGERVTSLARAGGLWRVGTDKGEIVAEVVVNAAGYRAGEVMALLGRPLPLAVMSHQYLVTEDLPELAARAERLPLLRDPDTSWYLRQERHGFILGPYEWQATPMWRDGIPDDFAHRLWDQDLERVAPTVEDAMARVPLLASAGIRRTVNGPIPYAPDGNPYIGPEPGLSGFFHCNNFSFGITQAGGAGKALAEWVIDGGPEGELWALDRRRYTAYATPGYTVARAVETYQNEYAPAFPIEERPAGRPVRTSPLHQTLAAAGARFGARGGWERAAWFDPDGTAGDDRPSFRRARPWFDAVGREVASVRERVGIADLPGFSKFEVSGPGAAAHLDRRFCTRLPRPGRVALAYALTAAGGILSELTVACLAPERFYCCAAAAAEWHDRDILGRDLPQHGSVTIEERTEALGTLVLAGPRARAVLGAVTDADLSNAAFPWLSAREVGIAGHRALALRINYVGELGWELHAPVAALPAIHAALWSAGRAHGIRHFGLYAIDSLRLDKAYRGWKTELECDVTPFEAGLGRFVDPRKLAPVTPSRRIVPLLLDAPGEADAPACAPVFAGDVRVGLVTSGGWSHTLGRSVALAHLRTDLAVAGTPVTIEIFGERRAATVATDPPYDPQNLRPRS